MAIHKSRLHVFPFLSPLDDAELEQLAPMLQERHYPARTIIFDDGQIGDRFHLLETGRVEIVKPTPEGQVLLNVTEPGSYFGELSLLDGSPHFATALAKEDSTVIEMPKQVFLSLTQRFPALVYHAALQNAEHLRRSDLELIDELKKRNQELRELYDTSLDISRHLELDQALSAIVDRAAGLLKSARGTLHLYQPARNLLIARPPIKPVRPGEGATGQAFASGNPVIQNGSLDKAGARNHELAAPIALDTNTLGTLTVNRPATDPPFTPEDARLLLLLANQAAIAIENARLVALAVEKSHLDGELSAARLVQHSLIPNRAPRIPGFQISGLWQPAREVAGDFYDFIPLGNKRWGIVIADVSDKGVPAALFMANARSTLRACLAVEPDPARTLERANRILAADSSQSMFVTVFLGILDARARRFVYANAGHNPPLLWRSKAKRFQRMSQHGLALGLDPTFQFTSREVEIKSGDLLVLYTDGVTDAVNDREKTFAEARLARVVRANAKADAPAVVRSIVRGVHEFIGAQPLLDDVTLVTLSTRSRKRRPGRHGERKTH